MKATNPPKKSFGWLACFLIAAILVVMFWKAFLPNYCHFSNDGPMGYQNAALNRLPQGFHGMWVDLWGEGWNGGAALPDMDMLVLWALGSAGYASFYIPIALFILGMGAYFCFRRLGLSPVASILGGLAACLTTNFFSDGCWGAAPAVFAFGMDFLALGALAKRDKFPFWLTPALAGLAIGLNVVEAADIGGMFSLLIAAFILYQAFVENGAALPARVGRGFGRLFIVAAFAGFIAAYGLSALVGATVKGISGTQEDAQAKATRWEFATEWSLPKRETLSLIIPGLFGDRVDYSDERAYWGSMGRDASWDRFYGQKLQAGDAIQLAVPDRGVASLRIESSGDLTLPSIPPIRAAGMTRFELQKKLDESPLKGVTIQYGQGFARHTGRGVYFGLLVVIVGLWASFQSFRTAGSVFGIVERKFIWFWSAVAVIALLLAHGKYSPFVGLYHWLYIVLPGTSNVRSPEKFLHAMNFAVLILFAYGIDGIKRRYFDAPLSSAPLGVRLKNWWAKAAAFDRRWVIGSAGAIVVALVGWLVYAVSRPAVERYLQDVQLGPVAHAVTGYSLQQVGWFVMFLVLNCGLLLLIFIGAFAGSRAKWGGILLGALLVCDLGRADLQFNNPWKDRWDYGFWNYKEKYEVGDLNPICKFLADKPYEHRVQQLPAPPAGPFSPRDEQQYYFENLYNIEWLQQIFPYYNIQSLDIEQLPRYPLDMTAFNYAQGFPGATPYVRLWELTNTRYLLGPSDYAEAINQQLDPVQRRFRVISNFRVGLKPGVEQATGMPAEMTAIPTQQPEDALIEFTGALPRVKLYANWETNSPDTLRNFTTQGLSGVELAVLQMVGTNDFLTLKKLMSPTFDPARTVLVDRPIAAPVSSAATNQDAGQVEFTSYFPTDIKFKAIAKMPAVLLLNDRYDPMWQVWVDGKPAELLRCNFLMRGVSLQPGQHEVEFRFRQPVKMLYVNLAAVVVGVVLLGYAMVVSRKGPDEDDELAPEKTTSKQPERQAERQT